MSTTLGQLGNGEDVRIEDLQPHYREMSPEDRTSWFLSEMLISLNDEQGFSVAMDSMLRMLSTVIHTDWLAVFECAEAYTEVVSERCSAHMHPMLGQKFDTLNGPVLNRLFSHIGEKPMAFVPDVALMQRISPALHEWFVSTGITSFMAAPFYNDGQVVGFLGAYNYRIDETVDLGRIFKAVSSFVGARIENQRLIKTLEWASNHDALTGLYNRRGSMQILRRFESETPEDTCALILIDLDDFKRINDLYGHAVGDDALRAVAKTLENVFGTDALVCRSGGDEFLAALMGENALAVSDYVEKLSQVPLEYAFEDTTRKMTVSIGYACYPEQASNINDLYAKADAALYDVKLAGKAGYGKYRPDADSRYRSLLGFTARDVAEHLPYSLIIHKADEPSSLLYASASSVELLECENMYELMQLTNGAFSGLVPDEDVEIVRKRYIKHALSEGSNRDLTFDYRMRAKTGTIKEVHALSRLIDIPDTGLVFYTFITPVDK